MKVTNFESLLALYGERLIGWAIDLAAAALILVAGLWIAAWAGRAVRRIAKRSPRIDETVAAVFAWTVRYGLTAAVLIAVLNRFGVETTSVVAIFGAAALAIGLALQGTLSNVAAGVMLVLFRPYKIGDSVELNGRVGTVHDINLFVTELIAPDHAKIVLPNAMCWNAPILNFTAFALRRVDVDFTVPAAVPIVDALRIVQSAIASDESIAKDPAPGAIVKSIEFDRTILTVQAWSEAGRHPAVRSALLARIKAALDARNAS